MSEVVIYSSRICPYCIRAKQLLKGKGLGYREIEVIGNPEARREAMARSGRQTVPQIWIGDHHVGGCDDLYALERNGALDKLLEQAGIAHKE